MNLKTVFNFFGGLPLALILIFSTTCFVICGTFLESITDSHRFAAVFTYSSPLFSFLLVGFFINILLSALRRYPFKRRHIPFLLTHLGMLMVIGGTLTKNYFGVQGTMTIVEGSASDEIFIPDSYALLVESKTSTSPLYYTFPSQFPRYSRLTPFNPPIPSEFEPLTITLLDHTPNSYEVIDSWIKNNHLSIFGLPPFPVQHLSSNDELPSPILTNIPGSTKKWNLSVIYSEKMLETAKRVYQNFEENSFPALLVIKDSEGSQVFLFSEDRKVASTFQRQENVERILAYDDGYLGYSKEASFPELEMENVQLESPLSLKHRPIPPSKKLESNIPCVALRCEKGDKQEMITLSYNPVGNGFKWPILNGSYLVRFQPLLTKIPYRVRLRQARQINYAGSQQPYSYEGDLIFTDTRSGKSVETSVSMNNVHETWDGYRFYLSNISPPDKGSLKHVQIVVNRDPAKYYLTYPGACFMTLGIALLFFGFSKKRKE